jgi:class 3 adenylate cyclase/tetratricopeptide (TPR) repeat protein
VNVCPSCGQENPDGFRFCGACGAELEAPRPTTPEERKTITVLFADMVGFTSRADRLDPEDVRRMVEPCHARLRHEVERHGGTVEKFIGDAVMAVFGAPVAYEDDPERAVRAALAMRESIAEASENEDGPRLSVRIGVNTGEALVKLHLSPDEGERIVADFVNVAARLQAAAPVDGVLVGEATFLATARAIEYQAFEPVRAKGKAEPILAWEAVAARARVGSDFRERGRAPLVGRLDEVQLLCDAFSRARRESSVQLVTLVGPPGIGKSRVVLELSSVVADDPELISWRRGTCLPYGSGAVFWPLVEMIKAQAGILETDSAEEAGDQLRREVADVVSDEDEARWVEAHLRPLLGLAREGEARGDLGEDFAAWRRFIESLAERSPVVLLFEDLHWADDGFLDFLDYLVDWATGVPLLVVCTARTELLARRSGWGGGKPNAVTISLSPLSDEETEQLLDELLEQAVLPSELKPKLLARAGGNPLYAEEFVRMLAERDRGEDGDELPVPESVQGIVAARLDTLLPEEKAVLQDAAVVGKIFWLGAVGHIGGAAYWTLDERLRSLERKQFVRRERRSTVEGEIEYMFRHLLVREVAYGRIPRDRRAQKHRLAAEWIESLGRAEDQAETLAFHYARALELARAAGKETGELAERTRVALRAAGDRASALKSYAPAARFYAAALDLWPRDDADWPALSFRRGRAIFFAEDGGDEELAEAQKALLAVGDRERAAEAEAMLGQLAFRHGERDRSVEHYDHALALLEDAPASESKARVLSALARSLVVAAKSEEGLRAARETLAMARELELDELVAKTLMTIGDARIELGDLDGMEDFERGIAMAIELSSPESASGLINLADAVMDLGDLERAIDFREQAERVAERFGDAKGIRWLRAELCGERYWTGRWDESVRLADDFIAESEACPRHYQEILCRVVRGRIRLARGGLAGAVDDSAKALDFARLAKDPQALYPSLAFSARTLLEAGQTKEGSALASELLDLVRLIDKTPVGYLWLLDLAVAFAELDRGDELLAATARVPKSTPWLEAARAVAGGEPEQAAEIYAEIGAKPDEALARLRAARTLAAEGRGSEAEAQLTKALAFYRAVGASRAVEAGERILVTGAARSG